MPRWEQDSRAAGPIVQGISANGFAIDGQIFEAVLLTPERAEAWTPPPLQELRVEQLEAILPADRLPEFLILGTGRAMAFPPRDFTLALEKRGVGLEAMDSRAAARTWGMLRGEGRLIAAALMPLS